MSATPISPVTNGVHGGHSHPSRGHRRAHGLSLTGSLSHSGHLAPPTHGHLRSPSSPLVQSFTASEAALKYSPVGSHSRHHSELLSPASSHDVFYSPRSVAGFSDQALPTPLSATMNGHIHHEEEDKFLEKDRIGVADSGSRTSAAIAGILISLPYVALSALQSSIGPTQATEHDEGLAQGRSAIVNACATAAIALLSLGVYRRLLGHRQDDFPGKDKPRHASISARTVAITAVSVFLPFYAACLLNGGRVVIVLLVTLSLGLPRLIQSAFTNKTSQLPIALLLKHKFTALLVLILVISDMSGMSSVAKLSDTVWGYATVLLAVPVLQPGLPVNSLLTQMNGPASMLAKLSTAGPTAALTDLFAGSSLAAVGLFASVVSREESLSASTFFVITVIGLVGAFATVSSRLLALQGADKASLVSGLGAALTLTAFTSGIQFRQFVPLLVFSCFGYIAVSMDSGTGFLSFHRHDHNSDGGTVKEKQKPPSRITIWLMGVCERWPLVHSILKERDSRRIFYFMCLNFAFMLVQMAYGVITGSLGLLSDSIHMLFDCAALAVGLAAAVMSKWPPSARFPYGYGKIETLAGFANGIFLMIISIEIIYEAVERLHSGSEVHRLGELFFVSTLGLLVNMVGIFAFDHAHHGHGGHDHSHDHGNENMHGIFLHVLADALGSVAVIGSTILVHFFRWPGFDPLASCLIAILIFVSAIPLVMSTSKTLLLTLPADVEYTLRDTLGGLNTVRGVVGYNVPRFWLDDTKTEKHDHDHDHGHGHDHHHHHHHEHHEHDHHHSRAGHHHAGCDSHSSHKHSHDDSHDHSHDLSHDHGKSKRILGVIHIIAARNADLADVEQRTLEYFNKRNMDILIQVEREGDGQCWCGPRNNNK